MVNKTVTSRFVLKGDNQLAAAFGGAQRQLGNLKRHMLAFGVASGLVARQVIKNTIEQERQVAQLNAALKSTGRYSEETSRALQDHATSLQDVTNFGDQAVISAQALLLTFKEIGGDVFPRATETVLDMSQAMGQDLKSTVVQVGKALNDPIKGITALSRVGVTFTEQQKETIRTLSETGRMAEAQGLILKELESEFGGSARAARDTFGGAMIAVQNALGDLLEVDGDSLPAAQIALEELAALLKDPQIKQGFNNLTAGVVNLTGAIAEGMSTFVGFSEWLGESLAAALHGAAMDDLPRLEDELEALRAELKRSEEAFIQWGAAGHQADLRARIAQIETMIALNEELARGSAAAAAPAPDMSGLGGGGGSGLEVPTEVTATGRKKDDIEGIDAWVEMHQRATAASEELRATLNALGAEIGGPVVQASQQLADQLAMLDEHERALVEAGRLTLDKEQQLSSARSLAIQQYEERIALIEKERIAREAALTPAQQMIADLEREIELVGLSNIEREKAVALQMAGVDANSVEGEQIAVLIDQKAKMTEAEAVMSEFRGSAINNLTQFATGAKSASEAWDSFVDDMIAQAMRLLAEKAIMSIFGGFGSGGAGSDSGLFGTALSTIFGGARAAGGPVSAGVPYLVGERGPELVVPRTSGTVVPNHQVAQGGNQTTHLTINLPPETKRRTALQHQEFLSRELRRASNRNG